MISRPKRLDNIPQNIATKTALVAVIASVFAAVSGDAWSKSTWCSVDKYFCKEDCDTKYEEQKGECDEINSGTFGVNECLREVENERTSCKAGCDSDFETCS